MDADGKPGKLREFDLLWDTARQTILIVRICGRCTRLVILPWTARTASQKSNTICTVCGKGP